MVRGRLLSGAPFEAKIFSTAREIEIMAYVIAEPCIGTKDTACVPVCPVSAIYAGDDLPEKWAEFTAKNAAHFGR
jgi:NAD-dependent dihydropyrimidine dehydrogenase PreA subunit